MFQVPIIIGTIEDHDLIKDLVLDSIAKGGFKPLDTLQEQITLTDWSRKKDTTLKPYQQIVVPHIIKEAGYYFEKMNYLKFDNDLTWFQQYEQTDFHDWHRHHGTDWGFVYYLELPEDGPPTEFRNPLNENETYAPKVKEGQFVLFPSCLEHRSAENQSKGRKTVIVTNFMTM